MSIRYSDDFKKEVVKAYMAGDKSTVQIAADYNIAKSTISQWVNRGCGRFLGPRASSACPRQKSTAVRSNAHFTKYAFLKTGGLFDQQPVSKDKNLVPRKIGLDTEKYGGYNKSAVMFFIPVHYKTEKDEDTIILSVELMHGKHFLNDETFAKEYAIRRIYYSIEKTVTEISFPMGLKPWKINTVLSLDGFRMCITAISSKGKKLSLQSAMQFTAGSYWNGYVKKLENLVEKVSKNPSYIYTEKYDKVNRKENEQLYDLYIDKLKNSIYCKRWAVRVPLDILINGKSTFDQLSEIKQAEVLLNIHSIFGRNTRGSDLSALGGKIEKSACPRQKSINFIKVL